MGVFITLIFGEEKKRISKNFSNEIPPTPFFWFCDIFINKIIMKKVIRLTERDLTRIVKRVVNEMDGDSDYEFSFDIKSVRCDDETFKDGHVDIKGDTIVIRYCKGDDDSLEYLKRKGKKLFLSQHGM
jgi:hypothetical protein